MIGKFDVGVEEQDIRSVGLGCSLISSVGGHAATNHADVQTITEAHYNFGSAIR
jgi:hypothetical protein